MGAKATAHPDTRIIELTEAPVGGRATIDVVTDIYSDLKEDWLADTALQALKFPMRSFGPSQGSAQIGPYVFIDNISGWRMQPYDDDYTLTTIGNLVGESDVQGIFVPLWIPRPGRTIRLAEQLSAQALTVQTGISGLTPEEAAQLQFLVDNEEADEEIRPESYRKLHKTTKVPIVSKTVSPPQTDRNLDLTE